MVMVVKYGYLGSVKFWIYIARLVFLLGGLWFFGNGALQERAGGFQGGVSAAVGFLWTIAFFLGLAVHNILYLIKISKNQGDGGAKKVYRKYGKKLKRKYRGIIFSVYFFGLCLGFVFTYVLALLVADFLSVSLFMPNCMEDRSCSALSVIIFVSCPALVSVGVLIAAFTIVGRFGGVGYKDSLRVFLFSRFLESWYEE